MTWLKLLLQSNKKNNRRKEELMAKISNIRGAMEVIELLQFFGGLPLEQVRRYLKKYVKAPFPDSSVKVLTDSKTIYYDKEDEYIYLYKGTAKNPRSTCAFEVYLQMCKDNSFRFSHAKYPFDYIFEVDNKLYQIIDFSSEGIYKLNFRKHQAQTSDANYDIIPIIMLINTPKSELLIRNNLGEPYLLPEGEYIIAHIRYDNIVKKITMEYHEREN